MTKPDETLPIDYDGKWKQLIERQPRYFIQFFLSEIYDLIDFSIPPKLVNQDVAKIAGGERKKGDLVADIIFEVSLKSGKRQFLYIHVEVQSSSIKNFGEKMFNPFYRLRDKYNQEVTAFALFVGETIPIPHNYYEYKFGKTKVRYDFPAYICKEQDKEVLKKSNNPYAIAVLTCIYLNETKNPNNFENRMKLKEDLIDFIMEENQSKRFDDDTILAIFDFVINIMILPKPKTIALEAKVRKKYSNMKANTIQQEDLTWSLLKSLFQDKYPDQIAEVEDGKAEVALGKKEIEMKKKEMEVKKKAMEMKKKEMEMKKKEMEIERKEVEKKNKEIEKRNTEIEKEKQRIRQQQGQIIITLFNEANFSIEKIATHLKIEKDFVEKVIAMFQEKKNQKKK